MTALRLISRKLIQKDASLLALPVFAALAFAWLSLEVPSSEAPWQRGFSGLLFLLKAALGHRLAWFIWHEWQARPFGPQLKDQAAYLGTAWILSFSMIAFQAQAESLLAWAGLMGQLLCASLALHGALLYAGLLDPVAAPMQPEEKAWVQVEVQGNQRTIPLEQLLAVSVEDHYVTLHYREAAAVKSLRVYGRLVDYEAATEGQLFKISRSALVRPEAIEDLGKGRNPELKLKGLAQPFSVSRSKKKELEAQLEQPGA
ncbi:MAG: LytTR family DNA-binding domain-containing protein [bacterium]|nr:LytTR family DNA-binding domain-containing protein [bacterium]